MSNLPTEGDILANITESISIFAHRQRVGPELPTATCVRQFDIGTALLATSLMADSSGEWRVTASFNGIEFDAYHEPEGGPAICAFEDECLPLIPVILTAVRDVAEGTAVLGVARPASADSILTSTQIALAAIGPRLDPDDAPVTHQIAVVYTALQEAVQTLLAATATALQRYWEVRLHDAHARAVVALEEAIGTYDKVVAEHTN